MIFNVYNINKFSICILIGIYNNINRIAMMKLDGFLGVLQLSFGVFLMTTAVLVGIQRIIIYVILCFFNIIHQPHTVSIGLIGKIISYYNVYR